MYTARPFISLGAGSLFNETLILAGLTGCFDSPTSVLRFSQLAAVILMAEDVAEWGGLKGPLYCLVETFLPASNDGLMWKFHNTVLY